MTRTEIVKLYSDEYVVRYTDARGVCSTGDVYSDWFEAIREQHFLMNGDRQHGLNGAGHNYGWLAANYDMFGNPMHDNA